MTTFHLGDCLNGCEVCATRYHEKFTGVQCDTCYEIQEG